jgi:amino-acid N-acetyltransferase
MAGEISASAAFSEKGFYLREFQGMTLTLAFRAGELGDAAPIEGVLKELEANATRVLIVSTRPAAIAALLETPVVAAAPDRLEGAVWRCLARSPRAGVVVPDGASGPDCREVALRLGLAKLVWLDREGGLRRGDGGKHSFVDLDALRVLLAGELPGEDARRRALLREVEALLAAGLPALNLCEPAGLGDELFTYAGSGTLFTRERYVTVRRLGLDDYDAADDLIARGVAEGYLAPRSPEEIEQVLAHGFGAFVEGRHLAGIGALLVHAEDRVGEIASLYTLTRFLGEGVGAHLVGFALERARERDLRAVVACTTSDRVVGFFERQGFRRVGPDALPAAKWRGYDPVRRASLRCLRREVA